MCPSIPYPWDVLWPSGPWQKKKKNEPRTESPTFPSTLPLTTFFCPLWVSNWPEAFGWLGRPLIIQKPLWGVLRNLAAQKLSDKAIQALKPPLKLREIPDSGMWMVRQSYPCVVPGAASVSLRLGLGHSSCAKWRRWGFWPSTSPRVPRADLGDQNESFYFFAFQQMPLPKLVRTWFIRTFQVTRAYSWRKGRKLLEYLKLDMSSFLQEHLPAKLSGQRPTGKNIWNKSQVG